MAEDASQQVASPNYENRFTPAQPTRIYKLKWWARAKHRSKYHELEFLKRLERSSWRRGRRIPVSGPGLGWADIVCCKDEQEVYRILLAQLRPRKKSSVSYFSGKAILSLEMLEDMYKPTFHSNVIRIEKLLVAVLRGAKIIYHEVKPEDLARVGLTDAVFSRITLSDPVGSTKILQRLPSPIAVSTSGKPLNNYYDYLGSVFIGLHATDVSNWQP